MRTRYACQAKCAYPLRMCYRCLVNQREIKQYFAKFGKEGGKARAKKLTPEERKESARKAARARWAKQKAKFSRDTET